eukprot:69218_1
MSSKKSSEEAKEKAEHLKRSIEKIKAQRLKYSRDRRKRATELEMKLENEQCRSYRERRRKLILKDFDVIKIIAKGIFSEVRTVRDTNDNVVYTMKIFKKRDIICKNRTGHRRAARDLLIDRDHTFLLKPKHSFQDNTHLYFVLKYFSGDLMTLLIAQNILTEKQTVFYISELASAIKAAHEFDFVIRDLKPENILIASNGHIKLSDFDMAAEWVTENDQLISKCQQMNSNDIVACQDIDKQHHGNRISMTTVDYIAPEVFGKRGYDKMVDWWSMGVIMFECLIGYSAFYRKDPLNTAHIIRHYRKYFRIPKDVKLSREAIDLMHNLICSHRRRYSVEQIKNHAFMKNVDWDDLMVVKPPFIVVDKFDILVFGYMRMMLLKLQLSYGFPEDIIELIVSNHGLYKPTD